MQKFFCHFLVGQLAQKVFAILLKVEQGALSGMAQKLSNIPNSFGNLLTFYEWLLQYPVWTYQDILMKRWGSWITMLFDAADFLAFGLHEEYCKIWKRVSKPKTRRTQSYVFLSVWSILRNERFKVIVMPTQPRMTILSSNAFHLCFNTDCNWLRIYFLDMTEWVFKL